MRKGGLRERIAQNLVGEAAADASARPDTARLLDDLARALKEAADKASTSPPSRVALKSSSAALDHAGRMPQILDPRYSGGRTSRASLALSPRALLTAISRLSARPLVAPAVLAAGLAIVVLLLLISIAEFARLPGLAWVGGGSGPAVGASRPPVAANAVLPGGHSGAGRAPSISPEERRLMDRAEAMIARGDIGAARDILAQAASAGSTSARFALAETFDPNMLAAWGTRDPVAEVGTARTLYEQTLSAGDERARARIEALKDEP